HAALSRTSSLPFFPLPPPPTSTLFPYTTLFRSIALLALHVELASGVMTAPVRLRDWHRRRALVEARIELRVKVAHGFGQRRELRSEEHTSELQSLTNLVCRLLLAQKTRDRNALY